MKQLACLGKHYMGIYFIHYYLIFGMPELHSFIESQDTLYVFRGAGCKAAIEVACLLPVSVILAYSSILIRKLFDFCPRMSECLFGSIPK